MGGVEMLGAGRAGMHVGVGELGAVLEPAHQRRDGQVRGPGDLAEDGAGVVVELGVASEQVGRGGAGVVAEEEDGVAAGSREPGVARGAGPGGGLVEGDQGEREVGDERLERGRGAVCRAVVDHDHLSLDAAELLLGEAGERGAEHRQPVARRDNHGQMHAGDDRGHE